MIFVSYKESYKGFDSLLMTADAADALALSSLLRRWASEPRRLSFSQIPLFHLTEQIQVEMYLNRGGRSGMVRMGDASYAWILLQEDAVSFAELAEGLANAGHPGHAYLETRDGDVSVVLSLSESS